jgi:prefoldin subunit 5
MRIINVVRLNLQDQILKGEIDMLKKRMAQLNKEIKRAVNENCPV